MTQATRLQHDHVALVTRAAEFAAQRHTGQHRKGAAQEPYVNHLAEVAWLLAETAQVSDAALVAAGWLHDTLEKTKTTKEELEAVFGSPLVGIVAEVTDDKSLPDDVAKRLQVETAGKRSEHAKLLTIADKTSNLRDVATSPPKDWSPARMAEYVRWTEAVVASCRGLNADLERAFDMAAGAVRAAILVPDPHIDADFRDPQ